MGYSFVLLDVPSEIAALRERADDYFAGNSNLKDAVDQYHSAIEPYSFHCNLAGIGLLRSTMRRLGMLAEGDPQPFPTCPSWDASHYTSAIEHRLANSEVWAEYETAEHAAMRQRAKGPGIARFKFLSNGPWIVLAEEVAQALDNYDSLDDVEQHRLETESLWGGWLQWLRTACAGFEVG